MKHRPALARALALCLCAALAGLAPGDARADNNSILTIGVGAGIGYRNAAGPGEVANMEFINQATVRLKMLWVLGADLSVDLTHDPKLNEATPDELRYAAKLRMTALFYPIPTDVFGLYLGVGVGAGRAGELFSVTNPSNSYHAGGGVEVHVNNHFTIDASFYMIIPGYASVRGHVEQLALKVAEDTANGVANGGPVPSSADDLVLPDLTVGDYISPTNYELMIRIMLFL